MEENLLHMKESKIKCYTISYKQTAAKFAKGNSINSASLKFNVDRKRIRERVNNMNEISAKNQLESDLIEMDASH